MGFPANSINGKRFQFVRKYEHAESINDNSIIPVLIITTPQMYYQGRILYKGKYQDLKSFLVTNKRSATVVKYFIVPDANMIQGNRLGTLTYKLNIDSFGVHDPYGFIADEINQIVKLLYWSKICGKYYSFNVDGKPLHFVPQSITPIDTGAIIRRLLHTYSVRSCHFA